MSKSEQHREITRARERADLARLRFSNSVGDIVDRLTPDRLRAEAIEIIADQLERTRSDLLVRFKNWPVAAGAAAAVASTAVAVFTFWKPARGLLRYIMRFASVLWTARDLWRRFR